MSDTPLLDGISEPADLRALPRESLKPLCDELRGYLIDTVSRTGGHLSSNLGTIELTIALHYVFATPHDRLVWDVGHQTYAHKVLTGRRQLMPTLRQHDGLAGFPKRSESGYDTFGVGHSSTSISAALGMAVAARQRNDRRRVVAIIGDGAMTAGLAFEALNNAGVADADLLVILNDNDMSISPPVGALNKYLARLFSGGFYSGVRNATERVLGVAPPLLEFAKRAEEHVKGMLTPGTLFEEFGFNYIGPIDGHDLDALIPTLENLRDRQGPQFLHVITRKGQGYKLAEADPVLYHGVSRFKPEIGIVGAPKDRVEVAKPTYTQVFGDWLCDMAQADPRLIGITPAMREGSGLVRFAEEHPDRYFDVGIAEQHALTFAAGLACEGCKPVVAIYSTFLQRAYDQLIHDIALQNLDVTLAIDRGGLVGADGPTHHGAFDLSFLACIPNLVVMAPADEDECRRMLTTAFLHDGPAAVRYPRGCGPGAQISSTLDPLPIGRGEILRRGRQVALLAFGSMLSPCLAAADQLDATVANMRFVKPLDQELLRRLAMEHCLLVSVEENVRSGGAGSEVARLLHELAIEVPLVQLGLPDRFIDHGDPARLLSEVGLDPAGIVTAIRARLSKNPLAATG
jgi:1-deoxy-D-xylulose-5-phosphate synthase